LAHEASSSACKSETPASRRKETRCGTLGSPAAIASPGIALWQFDSPTNRPGSCHSRSGQFKQCPATVPQLRAAGIEFVRRSAMLDQASRVRGKKKTEEIADIAVIARHRAISEKSDDSAGRPVKNMLWRPMLRKFPGLSLYRRAAALVSGPALRRDPIHTCVPGWSWHMRFPPRPLFHTIVAPAHNPVVRPFHAHIGTRYCSSHLGCRQRRPILTAVLLSGSPGGRHGRFHIDQPDH
jgi:hypothetical protein